jgi:rfaE bifunctional protein nucleotidyltransferase chain/domain
MNYPMPNFEHKIIAPGDLSAQLSRVKAKTPLVFTNGCFDILHRGHVTYLAQARHLGNAMLVALNSDASVKRQGKGTDRPINKLEDRLAMIASLESVDYVTYFDSDTPLELILLIKPDILVKGGDWSKDKIVGGNEVIAYGGSVHSIPFLVNSSTTKLIEKIRHV